MEQRTNLFKYQKKTVKEMSNILHWYSHCAGFIDTGLGKTKISLHLHSVCKRKRMVVLCPKALMDEWKKQILFHTYCLESDISFWGGKNFKENEVNIFNIEAFQTRNQKLFKLFYGLCAGAFVVLDESTKIKNPKANRTKALIKLAEKAAFRLILTGTPVTQTPLDLFTQCQFLDRKFWEPDFKSFWFFKTRYAVLDQIYLPNRRPFYQIIGYQHMKELMETVKTRSVFLNKKDCLDLPEKTYQQVFVELNKEQRKAYDELKDKLYTEYKGKDLTVKNKVSLFLRFRQITGGFFPESGQLIGKSNPKVEFILAESGSVEKAIIWCSFTAEIVYILSRLKKEKIESVGFYGDMTEKDCTKAKERFTDVKSVQFFTANIQKGAFGLNLQNSSLAYFITRSLSNEYNAQAEDRQHRQGQKNPVILRDITAINTVDGRIYKMMQSGQDLMEKFKTMNMEDCFDII